MGATQASLRGGRGAQRRYLATMRAFSDCRLCLLTAADFGGMIRDWFPMAIHLLEGLFFGLRNSAAVIGERQRPPPPRPPAPRPVPRPEHPAAPPRRGAAGPRGRGARERQQTAAVAHRPDP